MQSAYIKDLVPLLSLTLVVANSKEIRDKNGRTNELKLQMEKRRGKAAGLLTVGLACTTAVFG
jgi:hypothetical protein